MQKYNSQKMELNATHFQSRNEPQFALANTTAHILSLPTLRAFWTGGAHHVAGNYNYLDDVACGYDLTGSGANARIASGMTFKQRLAPATQLISPKYWFHADDAQFDITGLEPYIHVNNRGITLGGWFYCYPGSIGVQTALMSKWDAATNNCSYLLEKTNTDLPQFTISANGIASVAVTGTSALISGTWYHIVGQYEVATQDISIWLDGIQTTASCQRWGIESRGRSINGVFMRGIYTARLRAKSVAAESLLIW